MGALSPSPGASPGIGGHTAPLPSPFLKSSGYQEPTIMQRRPR
jgi:hypothetical protein